jgi:hypothetical protein
LGSYEYYKQTCLTPSLIIIAVPNKLPVELIFNQIKVNHDKIKQAVHKILPEHSFVTTQHYKRILDNIIIRVINLDTNSRSIRMLMPQSIHRLTSKTTPKKKTAFAQIYSALAPIMTLRTIYRLSSSAFIPEHKTNRSSIYVNRILTDGKLHLPP